MKTNKRLYLTTLNSLNDNNKLQNHVTLLEKSNLDNFLNQQVHSSNPEESLSSMNKADIEKEAIDILRSISSDADDFDKKYEAIDKIFEINKTITNNDDESNKNNIYKSSNNINYTI